MAYIIDDDENRIQELKTQIDELAVQTFSPEVVARNESTRNTGVQTGDGAVSNPFPLKPSIANLGDIGLLLLFFLNRVDSHVLKMTVTDSFNIQFIDPPNSNKMIQIVVDITQDGTGGHTIGFVDTVNPMPTIGTAANERTVINLQTTDGGVSYQVTSQQII